MLERCIYDLSDAASASLRHSIHHCPDCVSKNLWSLHLNMYATFGIDFIPLMERHLRKPFQARPLPLLLAFPNTTHLDVYSGCSTTGR
jgi:hypothetical protein